MFSELVLEKQGGAHSVSEHFTKEAFNSVLNWHTLAGSHNTESDRLDRR